nr:hypothetical protein CFP56_47411 [Quercus suber]
MEDKTSKRKTYQEENMDATSEKVLMQKFLECVEVQAEIPKKIIGRLSEIAKEEAEKDKPKHEQSELT